MVNNAKMQKVLLGTLAVMLVASLLLVVAAFALPTPALAAGEGPEPDGCPRTWYENWYYGCGSCLSGYGEYVEHYWCQDDPCAGIEPRCWLLGYECWLC